MSGQVTGYLILQRLTTFKSKCPATAPAISMTSVRWGLQSLKKLSR